ncbi:MAG: hypothetical protein B6D46_05260 [Polyangiaceae bacterium UTPRO1]|nr:DUF58 domain-containing protein [Myxococcales bacterium]OQY67428.1 MAG: hypothetical protein B6D46_05260 [Polyangiaceae bacterium UTPRO1]
MSAATLRAAGGALDLADLPRFDGFTLHVRRGLGERPGERRFPGRRQASGVEIEAYSPYTPGDDLRYLDWSAMARLDQLLVRRFTAEREVRFHLLLDASASMDAPPADGKRAAAQALMVVLAYVGLAANDAVQVALLRGDAAVATSPVYRHRRGTLALAEMLAAADAAGSLRLDAACEDYARRRHEAGAALLVSDFMTDPAEVERAILALQARRFEVHLLHVIGASEIDPTGHFTRGLLVDVETGAAQPLTLTAAVAARYRTVLEAHLEALREVAARTRCTYARWTAGADLAAFVTVDLAHTGLVRRR